MKRRIRDKNLIYEEYLIINKSKNISLQIVVTFWRIFIRPIVDIMKEFMKDLDDL